MENRLKDNIFQNGLKNMKELDFPPDSRTEKYIKNKVSRPPKKSGKAILTQRAVKELISHSREFYQEGVMARSQEVMGLLIGKNYHKNSIYIDRIYRVTEGSAIEVQFREEHFHVYEKLDLNEEKEYVVGWYHSHPNIGLFLSITDILTHSKSFQFRNPKAIALVIDPSEVPVDSDITDSEEFEKVIGIFRINNIENYHRLTAEELDQQLIQKAKYYSIPWRIIAKK
ncbi:MAG: Mov34/MPN/PAD-1 family protein [Candidatus Ranarchaeia archaeon]